MEIGIRLDINTMTLHFAGSLNVNDRINFRSATGFAISSFWGNYEIGNPSSLYINTTEFGVISTTDYAKYYWQEDTLNAFDGVEGWFFYYVFPGALMPLEKEAKWKKYTGCQDTL